MANGFHILIVDDRPDTVLGLVDLLTTDRHRVEVQESSMEALALLARKQSGPDPFHLVILDVNMPILDGPGLLRELRRRGDRVPAAYVTGYQSVIGRIQAEGNAMGILGIIGKPPDQNTVAAILGKLSATRPGGRLEEDAFFGTGRIARGRSGTEPGLPSDGALARAKVDDRDQAAPIDIGAALEARTPRSGRTPVRNPAIQRTPTQKQPILPPQAPIPMPTTDGNIRRIRTPDPNAYYAPEGNSLRRPDDYGKTDVSPLRRDPVTGSYSRKPSGLFPAEPNPLPTGGTTTAIRRGLGPLRQTEDGGAATPQERPRTPSQVPTPPPSQPSSPGTGTVRLRRGLTGNQPAPPGDANVRRESAYPQGRVPTPAPPATRVVACAHCAGVFQVLIQPQPYAVQCVHCGQLNRIDPT